MWTHFVEGITKNKHTRYFHCDPLSQDCMKRNQLTLSWTEIRATLEISDIRID